MAILTMIGQLLLALTILVGLHEFGHFIFARIFGIRVNKFYIFFDFLFPLPNVLNFALWKKKSGDTEYGLGWFPLGGYVDIAGMIDETKDASQLSSTPEPYEFRSKPAWQRLFVMLGGIIVNVILGILIFWGVKFYWGEEYYSKAEVNKLGFYAHPLAQEVGIKTGDKVIKVNGQDYESSGEVRAALMQENTNFTIERNGEQKEIPIPNDLIDKVASKVPFMEPIMPFNVGEIASGMPAEAAGLKKGDHILKVDSTSIPCFQDFQAALKKNAGKKVDLLVQRGNQTIKISPTVTEEGTIGFTSDFTLPSSKRTLSFGESFLTGAKDALSVIPNQIQGFGRIFKGHISAGNAVSGPVGLAQMYGKYWDWERFWGLTGLLSMGLAFMNALPIPALDGGHVLVLLYEMITRRKPSEKFMERTQQVGTFILLTLMVLVLFNDTFKALFK
jgi:regulator of sigma E protease